MQSFDPPPSKSQGGDEIAPLLNETRYFNQLFLRYPIICVRMVYYHELPLHTNFTDITWIYEAWIWDYNYSQ